jgi:hypothetical protein
MEDPNVPEDRDENVELLEPEWGGPATEDEEFEDVGLDEEA